MMTFSIRVTGLPKDTAKEKLIIYFQKSKNGGGDVANVEILGNGTVALIEFEEEKTVNTVLQNVHKIGGMVVKVEKCEKVEEKIGNGGMELFTKIEATLCKEVLKNSGLNLIRLSQMAEGLKSIDIVKRGLNIIVTSDSFEEMKKFEKQFRAFSKKGSKAAEKHSSPRSQPPLIRKNKFPARPASPVNPIQHSDTFKYPQPAPHSKTKSSFVDVPIVQASSLDLAGYHPPMPDGCDPDQPQMPAFLQGAASLDPSISGWTDEPFRQPDGQILTEVQSASGKIVMMFCFKEGTILIPGDVIQYQPYECIVSLPNNQHGKIINEMLNEAFQKRKLFYIARNTSGPGFKIQCSYNMFGSDTTKSDTDLSSKLGEIKQRLNDLGIETPKLKKPDNVSGTLAHVHVPSPEPVETSPTNPVMEHKAVPKKVGPFPQPENLSQSSEYHQKDLPGYPGSGSIHMYFRSPGGEIQNNEDRVIRYSSDCRTACLPGTAEGRKLHGMILKAAHEKKLFVVAEKAGIFIIRAKVPLITSDDFPANGYLDRLYAALLKLGIEPPLTPPPLPPKIEAHYEDISDDEEREQEKVNIIKKGGPFPQPDGGVLRMEKENKIHNGFGRNGTIKVYFRFSGGKMKVEGSKPSRSFEVKYSQMNIVAVLPNTNEGKHIACMLKACFDDKKLFYVQKKDGEPSFRIRPCVTLLTPDNHPTHEYLSSLRERLLDLGMKEVSDAEVATLVIHNSTTPQGGPLPADWAVSTVQTSTQQNINPPAIQPNPHARLGVGGARPKMRRSTTAPLRAMQTSFLQAQRKDLSSQRSPGFAGMFGASAKSDKLSIGNADWPDNSCSTRNPSTSAQKERESEDKCAICLAGLSTQPTKKLPCKHEFHIACIDMALKTQQKCPYCNQPVNNSASSRAQPTSSGMNDIFGQAQASSQVFGGPNGFRYPPPPPPVNFYIPIQASTGQQNVTRPGNQYVRGNMQDRIEQLSLPGYEGCGTIVITYVMFGGTQEFCHPNPGVTYQGTKREAYLPNNAEGQDLLRLLRRAFNSGFTFTVGRSQSNGRDNQIIWNGIPHRTNRCGGPHSYGYPDPSYLSQLRKHLASIGIR